MWLRKITSQGYNLVKEQMVDTRTKGLRGEYAVRDLLRKHTGLGWERVPSSGALDHTKGDIYIPQTKQFAIIEVKNYKESALTDKVLTATTNNVNQWWTKLKHQSSLHNCRPMLFFKYDRSKWFIGVDEEPATLNKYLYLSPQMCYITLAEEWLEKEWEAYVKKHNST